MLLDVCIQMVNEITTVALNSWKWDFFFYFEKNNAIFIPCTFLNKFEYIVIGLCDLLSVYMINYRGVQYEIDIYIHNSFI